MKRTYRADIDGLRAISVACVILFHLNVPGFGGGFIGVDVFFVISGFLITGLIIENIERDVFSFIRFYERRARRILPMLITVVIASAGAGYFFLMPGDYLDMADVCFKADDYRGVTNLYCAGMGSGGRPVVLERPVELQKDVRR